MKAIFLIGGPGSGKAVVLEDILKEYSIKEYDSKQIKKDIDFFGDYIVVTENAYDIDNILADKIIVESKGYSTFLIYVDVSNSVCEGRTPFLSESVRQDRYKSSKNNIELLKIVFENYVEFNNDIDKSHLGVISQQIRKESIEAVKMSVSDFLSDETKNQIITTPPQNSISEYYSRSSLRDKLQEYCPGCQLTKTEFNPEKKSIVYDEEDQTFGNVKLTVAKQTKLSNFDQDKETKKEKQNKTPSIRTPSTSGSGIGQETALRYGGDSGSNFGMSGLGSVTYRENFNFSRFRNKLKEAIDSPSIDGDMGYIGGGWGQSNKDEFSSIGSNYSDAKGPITKKIKKEKRV